MTARDLRHECEVFVDRMLLFGFTHTEFERTVDKVYEAMKFLVNE